MADGHLGKCKQCAKKDVLEYRLKHIHRIREYDRKRGARQTKEYKAEYKRKYPNKFVAHNMVNNAIRCKKLFKEPCSECGNERNVHAHHDDYLKKLNVRWLCPVCHSQWHAKNGEAKNP